MSLNRCLVAAALLLLLGLGLRGESVEAQSRRYCATERALGRYPPRCPRPAIRPDDAPARQPVVQTRPLILRSGCDRRLRVMLDYRTARGWDRATDTTLWTVEPGATTAPLTFQGRQLALVSDEIYFAVPGENGDAWPIPNPVSRPFRGGQRAMARVPVSIDAGGAYVITFCRVPGALIQNAGRYTVYFARDPDITAEAAAFLDEAARAYRLLGDNSFRVLVSAHTDRRQQDPMEMTRRLAANVRNHLLARGIPADAIVTEAWGNRRPVVDRADEVADAQNRRVEILFGAASPR